MPSAWKYGKLHRFHSRLSNSKRRYTHSKITVSADEITCLEIESGCGCVHIRFEEIHKVDLVMLMKEMFLGKLHKTKKEEGLLIAQLLAQ